MQQHLLLLSSLILVHLCAGVTLAYERYSPAQCERIEKQIRRIHSEMRAGYSARRGVKLEARLRDLKLRRARHCR